MYKTLLQANPHAENSDAVMYELENRLPAMPQNYIDAIEAGEETVSQLDLLKNNVAAVYHLKRMIGESIKSNYKNDTTNLWASDSLLAYTLRQHNLLDKYELATIYLNRGLYAQMNNTLTDISNNFEFSEQQNTNHNNFMSTFAIAQNMYENNIYIDGLDDTQKATLETVLAAKGSQVSQMALALLMRNNPDYEFNELIIPPTENSARIAPKTVEFEEDKETFFKIYPNPTTDYFTLEYKIESSTYSTLVMEIYDATGRKIISLNLNNSDNATLIDVSKLSKGVYSVSFMADGNVLSVNKLTIVK